MRDLANNTGLETSWKEKVNLTDSGLALFFQQIRNMSTRVDNWKQHYAAWLPTYFCGARPGSYTVAPEFEKGADLGLEGKTREIDETLRWNHIQFIRFEGRGIGFKITFHYLKN